jgi:hypothetical protein
MVFYQSPRALYRGEARDPMAARDVAVLDGADLGGFDVHCSCSR